ncbi:hypothetical protein A3731_20220 [Roseovarius sp. HI0049]|nr:hypothetical protein A3731_20220 [Roseovarius sp. HI0049]
MTLQNRVLPTGEIIADPEHGTLMGNRGILHDDNRTLGKSRWKHHNWVTCLLSYKGRRRVLMSPGRYTELFFLDEATSLAAGHRPCGECRRDALASFRTAWTAAHGEADLKTIDRHLHHDRVTPGREQIRCRARPGDLPDGTFILFQGAPHLLHGESIYAFKTSGYHNSLTKPEHEVEVLTPACTVSALANGYLPDFHESLHDLL